EAHHRQRLRRRRTRRVISDTAKAPAARPARLGDVEGAACRGPEYGDDPMTKRSDPKTTNRKPAPTTRNPREGTKQAKLIEMLRADGGATIDEIVAATGWQKHTVRGAMSGALKKRLRLEVTSEKVEGR